MMKITLAACLTYLALGAVLLLAGCGGSSYYPVSGSARYGVYHGYDYYHHNRRYNDDVIVVDRDKAQKRRDHHLETRPERKQNVQAARSRGASMGRPVRSGGRGGRR